MQYIYKIRSAIAFLCKMLSCLHLKTGSRCLVCFYIPNIYNHYCVNIHIVVHRTPSMESKPDTFLMICLEVNYTVSTFKPVQLLVTELLCVSHSRSCKRLVRDKHTIICLYTHYINIYIYIYIYCFSYRLSVSIIFCPYFSNGKELLTFNGKFI